MQIFPICLKYLTPICLFILQLAYLYDECKMSYVPKQCPGLCAPGYVIYGSKYIFGILDPSLPLFTIQLLLGCDND